MNKSSKLIVYFDDSFRVSVFERIENGKLSVCKVIFGQNRKEKHKGDNAFAKCNAALMKEIQGNAYCCERL